MKFIYQDELPELDNDERILFRLEERCLEILVGLMRDGVTCGQLIKQLKKVVKYANPHSDNSTIKDWGYCEPLNDELFYCMEKSDEPYETNMQFILLMKFYIKVLQEERSLSSFL